MNLVRLALAFLIDVLSSLRELPHRARDQQRHLLLVQRRPDEVLHDRLQVAQAYEPVAVDVVDLETETERVGGRTTRQATDGGGRRTDGRDEMR